MQKRQQIKIARGLYKTSLKNGVLDTTRAQKVLNEIVKLRPQGLIGILQNYSRLISQALSWQTVVVESAETSGVRSLEKELLKKTGAQKAGDAAARCRYPGGATRPRPRLAVAHQQRPARMGFHPLVENPIIVTKLSFALW